MNDITERSEDISYLLGKIVTSIEKGERKGEEALIFKGKDFELVMTHEQDCCESVYLAEVIGDLNDIIGAPILMAEETSDEEEEDYGEISGWTFYKLATIKGYATIRWNGSSNGYYSIGVDIFVREN